MSRRQLPGAAVTLRPAVPAQSSPATTAPGQREDAEQAAVIARAHPVSALVEPRIRARVEPTSDPTPDPRPQNTQRADSVPRFSLVTIVAGDWLWLEEVTGMPLTTLQVQLVQSMALALQAGGATRSGATRSDATRPGTARADVMQFDWPIHTNRQLDQGEAAALAGVAGFLARRLEQYSSRGLVLLGPSGAARVPVQELGVESVCTASSADMLVNPELKRQVWRDLQPLIGAP